MMMKERTLQWPGRWGLALLSAACLGSLGVAAPAGTIDLLPPAGRPNIIFILADDLGWGDLSCYGNLDIQTPHLDRMAAEGILFEQFYVNASLCSPARAALLTGQFPARSGIHYWMAPNHNRRYGMPDHLDTKAGTLPRVLRASGYRTAHFGKWHLGESAGVPVDAYGFDEVDYIWQGVGGRNRTVMNDPQGTEKLVDCSIRFMEACLRDQAPFSINLWLRDVHADLRPNEAALARYPKYSSRGTPSPMQIYYAAVTEMDVQIGRLLQWIDERPPLAANTLVIFTSDNGPEDPYILHASRHAVGSAGPFRGRKRSLYEGGIRMPLIMRWKDRIAAGTLDRTSVVSGVDFLPTLAALAGARPAHPDALDGEDFSPSLLSGKPYVRKRPLFWEWRFEGVGSLVNRSPMLAVREERWKLLFNPDASRVELYDVVREPMETDNRADQYPDVVQALMAKGLAWQASLPAGPTTENPGSLEYPGYHEGIGRGPIIDQKRYEQMLERVRVRLLRDQNP